VPGGAVTWHDDNGPDRPDKTAEDRDRVDLTAERYRTPAPRGKDGTHIRHRFRVPIRMIVIDKDGERRGHGLRRVFARSVPIND
jgi:hypothetical protein